MEERPWGVAATRGASLDPLAEVVLPLTLSLALFHLMAGGLLRGFR